MLALFVLIVISISNVQWRREHLAAQVMKRSLFKSRSRPGYKKCAFLLPRETIFVTGFYNSPKKFDG